MIRAGKGGTNGGREAEAHRAGTTGGKPLPRGVGLVKLGGPHLVLTHVSGDDGVSSSNLVELVDNLLHSQATLLTVRERVFFPPTFDFIKPWLGIEAGDAFVDFS